MFTGANFCLVARFIVCKNEIYSIILQSPLSQLNYTYIHCWLGVQQNFFISHSRILVGLVLAHITYFKNVPFKMTFSLET